MRVAARLPRGARVAVERARDPVLDGGGSLCARDRAAQGRVRGAPGFLVYNPETLLRLRDAAGPELGANLDPSHFVWQGIDPIEAARVLGRAGALFYVHAKDVYLDRSNIRINGVLDTKHYGEYDKRSWSFRSVGYGQDEKFCGTSSARCAPWVRRGC